MIIELSVRVEYVASEVYDWPITKLLPYNVEYTIVLPEMVEILRSSTMTDFILTESIFNVVNAKLIVVRVAVVRVLLIVCELIIRELAPVFL